MNTKCKGQNEGAIKPQGSGRSFDETVAHLRSIVKYDGPPVSIEEMNETIAKCWEESALRRYARVAKSVTPPSLRRTKADDT